MEMQLTKAKPPKRLKLEESGTLHRQAQAHRLGDRPEDAPSTDTPGIAVRRYNITDMLSYLLARGLIARRQHDGGLKWREDYQLGITQPKVTARFGEGSGGGTENWTQKRLAARKRWTQAGEYLDKPEYLACFSVILEDHSTNGRIVQVRSGLRALADWYGVGWE